MVMRIGDPRLNEITERFKAIDRLAPIHEAQLLTYLKLSKLPAGLLINFNVPILKQGIKRLVNQPNNNSASPRLRGEN